MKKIGVVPNKERDINLEFTKKAIKWLIDNGCEPMVLDETSAMLEMPKYKKNVDYFYKEADFLLVLGGDGTILGVAKNSAMHGTPILGVNLGTLGYLTDVEKGEAFHALKKAILGEYKLDKRMMLEADLISVKNKNCSEDTFLALNEICIGKSSFSSMISLELRINDEYIDEFRADGIIISTPTGSTAYNLSAGGPILKPDIEVIAITPVCPHMLYTRPSVISAEDIVKITVTENNPTNPVLYLDGQDQIPLEKGDSVLIGRSKYFTNIVKTNNKSFYDILRHKIK